MTTTQETQAWEALKRLGDAALERGGVQAVLQMFVAVLTSAEQVAQESEAAGNPDEMATEVISTWLSTTYVPEMLEAMTQTQP